MKPQRAGLARGAVIGAAAVATVAALATTSPWRGFEERAEGVLLQARGPLPWNPEVVIIAVDDASLRRLGWPVERQAYALVLNAVVAAGAKAAGFDIFFTDPARDGPEGDALFAEVARQFGRVAFPAECSLERLPEPLAFPAGGPLVLSRGATPARACPSLVFPHGPLAGAATLAHVLVPVSSSGNIRGQQLFIEEGEHRLPSLAVAMYLLGKGLPASAVVQEPGETRIERLRVPVNREGGVLASYRGGLPKEAVIPFDELANTLRQGDVEHLPESLAGRLRGKYVLFGQTAGGIGDHGPIITGEQVPLVAVHAALLSDLLEGRPVREA
jgi:CHASE2 domain-containing sensor protein